MVDYVDRFSHVESSLHIWDEVDLIMVYDFSDVKCLNLWTEVKIFKKKILLNFT